MDFLKILSIVNYYHKEKSVCLLYNYRFYIFSYSYIDVIFCIIIIRYIIIILLISYFLETKILKLLVN